MWIVTNKNIILYKYIFVAYSLESLGKVQYIILCYSQYNSINNSIYDSLQFHLWFIFNSIYDSNSIPYDSYSIPSDSYTIPSMIHIQFHLWFIYNSI